MYPAFLVSLSRYRDQAAESVKSDDLFFHRLTDRKRNAETLCKCGSQTSFRSQRTRLSFLAALMERRYGGNAYQPLNLRNPATKQSPSAFLCCTAIYQNSCLNLRAPVDYSL